MKKIILVFMLILIIMTGCEEVGGDSSGIYTFSITIDGTTHSFQFNLPYGTHQDIYTNYYSSNDWETDYAVDDYGIYYDFDADFGTYYNQPYVEVYISTPSMEIDLDADLTTSLTFNHNLSGSTLSGSFSGLADVYDYNSDTYSVSSISGSFYISDIYAY